jgi:hypothetical protein
MPGAPDIPQLALASFETTSGSPAIKFDVHFNPASLQYSIQNTMKEEGKGAKKKQHVTQSVAKLSMELVFDTTDSGTDVRVTTDQVAGLMKPTEGTKAPRVVKFGWGAYSFKGLIDQYKETLDYFSTSGSPLRSTISVTMTEQEATFGSEHNDPTDVGGDLALEPVELPANGPGAPPSAASVANQLGAPSAARAIAAANGEASLRFGASAGLSIGGGASFGGGGASIGGGASFGGGASIGGGASFGGGASLGGGASAGFSAGAGGGLSVSASVTLAPAAAFSTGVSAGIGGGAGIGAGIGIGGGIGIGASGAGGGIGIGISIGGSSAVAGGAFGALRVSTSTTTISIPNPRVLIEARPGSALGAGVQFGPGGRALSAPSGASLAADVGAGADLSARLTFSA